jgi:hypothetical protein
MIKTMKIDPRLNRQKGSLLEPVLMLAALSVIIFVFILPARKLGTTQSVFSLGNGGYSPGSYTYSNTGTESSVTTQRTSNFAGEVFLGYGSASYSYQPAEEYISIDNRSRTAVNITGWSVKNAKENRPYAVGNSLQRYPSDQAIIPQAARFVSPFGASSFQDVILGPNESAVISTGSIGARSPYQIVSFKENKCSGYLEELPEYEFQPQLAFSCARPTNEPGARSLDIPCQDYLNSMQSCHTPKFGGTDWNGQSCSNCVDKNPNLSSSCVEFIRTHYNYAGCIANHINDPDFSGSRWRIFLNRTWELWAKDHETITILDRAGNVVDYQSY